MASRLLLNIPAIGAWWMNCVSLVQVEELVQQSDEENDSVGELGREILRTLMDGKIAYVFVMPRMPM